MGRPENAVGRLIMPHRPRFGLAARFVEASEKRKPLIAPFGRSAASLNYLLLPPAGGPDVLVGRTGRGKIPGDIRTAIMRSGQRCG